MLKANKDGILHGRGEITVRFNGTTGRWEGDFRHGNGFGYFKSSDGQYTFEGTVKNMLPHGECKIHSGIGTKNDFLTTGTYKNGKMCGKGQRILVIENNSRSISEGMFENDNFINGTLKIVDVSGKCIMSYTGGFRDEKFHGNGKFTNQWYTLEGKFSGGACIKGKSFNHDGSATYEGEFNRTGELIRGFAYDASGNKKKVKKY